MNPRNIINDFWKQIIVGIVVSLIIAIFSLSKSFIFPDKTITGLWTVYVTTEKTNYKPFKNLTSIFRVTITQLKNGMIVGNGEKVRDINPDGSITSYATVQRDIIKFNGIMQQSLFGNATASLDIDCKGSRFKSTAHYDLTLIRNDSVTGTFNTTIADGSGHVEMKEDKKNND